MNTALAVPAFHLLPLLLLDELGKARAEIWVLPDMVPVGRISLGLPSSSFGAGHHLGQKSEVSSNCEPVPAAGVVVVVRNI